MPHNDLTPPLGFVARLFPKDWRPARQDIEFASQNEFQVIHFSDQRSGIDESWLGDTFTTVARAIAKVQLTASLEIMVFVRSDGRTAKGETPLDVLHNNLAAIRALPCRYVHWHIALLEPGQAQSSTELEDSFIEQFRHGTALAKQHNFVLGLEHNSTQGQIFSSPWSYARIRDSVPALKLVWDLNHTSAQQLDGFVELIPAMGLLHVSDTPLPELNQHLPIGRGTIDFPLYCSYLVQKGFQAPAILEIGGLPGITGKAPFDTDAALVDSARRFRTAFAQAR